MFADNNKISNRQLQILIISNTLGIGIIILPQIFFKNSIINMIPLLFFILIAVYLTNAATKNYEYDSFLSFSQKIFGITLAKLLSIFLLLKIFLTASFQLKLFSDIIKIYVLPKTPSYIVNLVLILSVCYLISKGYETRARLSEILIWLIILPLAIVFFITIFDIKSIPEIDMNINFIKAFESIFVFSQLDYLFLYNSFIKTKNGNKMLHAIIFSWIAIFFLTYIIKLKINFKTPYPIIKLMSITDIPGGFIQNYDFFIISFIIITFFSLISSSVFFSSQLFYHIGIKKLHILICAIFIFFISMIPKNISCNLIYILGTFFYFILPIIILLLNKKVGDKN